MAKYSSVKKFHINLKILNNPHSATHFICLPLYTSKSKEKLEDIVRTLRNDDTLAGVPQKAFRLPKSFHVCIHNLRVGTNAGINTTIKTLSKVRLKDLLTKPARDLANCLYIESMDDGGIKMANEGHSSNMSDTTPLRLTLRGTYSPDSLEASKARVIHTNVHDPSDRLTRFVSGVRHHFESEGIRYSIFPNGKPHGHGVFVGANLINGHWRKERKQSIASDGHRISKSSPRYFDFEPFRDKYKDFDWARDIEIEKLSLCKEGRKATFHGPNDNILVDEDYEEIASIPLPQ